MGAGPERDLAVREASVVIGEEEGPTAPGSPSHDPGPPTPLPSSDILEEADDSGAGLATLAPAAESVPLLAPVAAPVASAPGTPALGAVTAADALVREEAARTVGFARAVLIPCAVTFGAALVIDVPLWLRGLMLTATAGLGAAARWVARLARTPEQYTRPRARIFAVTAAATALVISYGFGVFSPAPIVVVLGISFFALGSDPLSAIGLPIVVIGGYGLLAALVALDVLPDAGAMSVTSATPAMRLAMTLTMPVVYALALWQARLGRRATVETLVRTSAAVRATLQRDKQLDEVNRDLDRLLEMGASDAGAYTGEACGKYTLGKLVGRGAMGEVYAAIDQKTGENAAVKLLQPGLALDMNLVLRFLREGEASSKLRAPNVVSIYEVGKSAKGAPYIAMELLRGHDLAWHLRHRARLALEEVVGIADEVAAGVEAARRAGIVHRDLKPQNIFLAQRERTTPIWKILDFGVSRFANNSGTLTQDQIVGTPGYMSPEQAAGTEATYQSDVFSFGAVVYRALTGELPFPATDTPQILYQVVYQNPMRPSEICPTLPPDVDLVLAIALAKDMDDRFVSAIEFSAALRTAAANRLHADLRLRAHTILAALPWGSRLREET